MIVLIENCFYELCFPMCNIVLIDNLFPSNNFINNEPREKVLWWGEMAWKKTKKNILKFEIKLNINGKGN